jgi:HEAT repeat protein
MAENQQKVGVLITDLGSKDEKVRIRARQSLVAAGDEALGPLLEALENPGQQVRQEAVKALGKINVPWRKFARPSTINALIDALGSKDGIVRVRARKALIAIGGPSVGPLVETLAHKKGWVRWEVAKALSHIGNRAAIQALVQALEDETFDIRWLAGEGLVAAGRDALVPLLKRLTEHPDSLWLREGAHYVLHNTEVGRLNEILQPVLIALEDVEPSVEVPLAARAVLAALTKMRSEKKSRW